jgi:hypothetical protein
MSAFDIAARQSAEDKLAGLVKVIEPIACDCARCCLVHQWELPNATCPYFRLRAALAKIQGEG